MTSEIQTMKKICFKGITVILLITLISFNFEATPQTSQSSKLIGTWQFLSLEGKSSEGDVFLPYGDDIFGRLMYDPDGYMSVVLMHPDRPAFASGDPMNGTPEEIKTAFERYDSYCGTYTIDEKKGVVIHHIQGSLFPNWVGVDQLRYIQIYNDTLTINSPPILAKGIEWNVEAKLVKLK